jgi:hypothetical protein
MNPTADTHIFQLNLQTPTRALNAAYRKEKVSRKAVEGFKAQLSMLFDKADPQLSEETLKGILATLLQHHGYHPAFHISVNNERQDLSIHLGKNNAAPVGVIVETKRPGSSEMMSAAKPNTKALHELVLYYLRERIENNNIELKHLVVTDVFQWFVIDANEFDKKIFQHKGIRRLYDVYRQDSKDNGFFYAGLKDLLDQATFSLQATHFSLQALRAIATNPLKTDDKALLPVFKLLSPAHLLKQPFANDSNSLDKGFYSELLHIIGLEEAKADNKKIIRRKPEGQRQEASLLENTLQKLQEREAIRNLDKPGRWGNTRDEQYFAIALELCITWMNRILFLKLLEAQLVSYHPGKAEYRFLHSGLVHDYDELANLFFAVLAEWPEKRKERLQQKFAQVPYLNSSLFERTELERRTMDIGALDNRLELPIARGTILKDHRDQPLTGTAPTLDYCFRFLNAYDFGSEGQADIQEENKRLINSSVLGLIFEKLNGYKDGSYFTPGFITMYMCSETLRLAVVQKFNDTKGWKCQNLDEVYNHIDDRAEANDIVNSLRVCDPAVGSGHFLVSALNEILLIKHDLRILQDSEGKRLKEYALQVVNDELIVTDEDGEPFVYRPGSPESQRVQETLFREKQRIIENCLFGADINPNSVKICRLRLWIELLKHAYYTMPAGYVEPRCIAALHTLPNIDINIQTGNSLVARFGLDADLTHALNQSRWNMDSYRLAIRQYHHAQSKEEKRTLEELIETIKQDFKSEVGTYDPLNKALAKLRGKMLELSNSVGLFGADAKTQQANKKKLEALSKEIDALEKEKEEIKNSKIYLDALEWRFVFPEVLNNEGGFTGFDVVLGNPPYIRQEEIGWMKDYLKKHYQTFAGTADLYVYFVERGMQLLKPDGHFCYILPNKWMKGGYGKALRQWARQWQTVKMVDFGDLPVFDEATTYPSIWLMQKQSASGGGFAAAKTDTLDYPEGLPAYLQPRWLQVDAESLQPESWNLVDSRVQRLLDKIKAAGKPLGEYVQGKIFYGIKTGLNEAFVIDAATRERLITEDANSAEIIKPFLAGRDIKRYQQPESDKYLILVKNGFTRERWQAANEKEAWAAFTAAYPAVATHLLAIEQKARARYDKGQYWWELRACDYYDEFEKPKIIVPAIVQAASYGYDVKGYYSNDKTSIIPTNDFYLLGILSSSVVDFYLKQLASTKQNGYYEYKPVYVSQLPIAECSQEMRNKVIDLVERRLDKSTTLQEITGIEEELDKLFLGIYSINEEERILIESQL